MENMLYALIPLAPFILGGFVVWSKHQQKMIEKQSEMTAEKQPNMRHRLSGWRRACASSNGSQPTAASMLPKRLKSCATRR